MDYKKALAGNDFKKYGNLIEKPNVLFHTEFQIRIVF